MEEININIKRYNLELTDDGEPILVENENGVLCLSKDLIGVETLASYLPTVSLMYQTEAERNAKLARILGELNIVIE